MSKRQEHPTEPETGTLIIKRQRGETPPSTQIAISSGKDERSQGLIRTVQRTSNLEAPIISLSGAHSVSSLKTALLIYRKTDYANIYPIIIIE